MSSATQPVYAKDAWQNPRNARTLRAFMALRNEQIAARIRELRAAKGNPPQPLVAAELGVGERTYQTWEQGEAKPGYRNLQRLAEYFGVGEDYILTGREDTDAEPIAEPAQLDRVEAKLDRLLAYFNVPDEPSPDDFLQAIRDGATAAAAVRRARR